MPKGDSRWVSPKTSDDSIKPKIAVFGDFYAEKKFEESRKRFDKILEEARTEIEFDDPRKYKNEKVDRPRKKREKRRDDLEVEIAEEEDRKCKGRIEELKKSKSSKEEIDNIAKKQLNERPTRSPITKKTNGSINATKIIREEFKTSIANQKQSKKLTEKGSDKNKLAKNTNNIKKMPGVNEESKEKSKHNVNESRILKIPGKLKSLIVNRAERKRKSSLFEKYELKEKEESLPTSGSNNGSEGSCFPETSSDECFICYNNRNAANAEYIRKVNKESAKEQRKQQREMRMKAKEKIKAFKLQEKHRRRRENERLHRMKLYEKELDKEAKVFRLERLKCETEKERVMRAMFKMELRAMKHRLNVEECEAYNRGRYKLEEDKSDYCSDCKANEMRNGGKPRSTKVGKCVATETM